MILVDANLLPKTVFQNIIKLREPGGMRKQPAALDPCLRGP